MMLKLIHLNEKYNLWNLKRLIIAASLTTLSFLFTANYIISNAIKFSFVPQIRTKLENYDFDYRITNNICSEQIYLLVIIHSAANHFEHRQTIRDTWGNPGEHLPIVKLAFLLAVDEDLQMEIDEENDRNRDIIQGDFIDSYRNLTYKHAMGLSWVSNNCNQSTFVLKMDDDIFIDIYQFMDYMQNKLKYGNLKNNIACFHQKSMPVVRDPVSKWYVSKIEYSSDIFEDYCSGWAYLTTPKVARRLYQSVKKVPYFWVDDVHLTGKVRKMANVKLIRLNNLYALESDGLIDWCNSATDLKWDKMFAPTWGDLKLIRRAHKKSLTCFVADCKCCYYRTTTPRPSTSSTTVRGKAQLIPLTYYRKKLSNR